MSYPSQDTTLDTRALAVEMRLPDETEVVTPLMQILAALKKRARVIEVTASDKMFTKWSDAIVEAEASLQEEKTLFKELRDAKKRWDDRVDFQKDVLATTQSDLNAAQRDLEGKRSEANKIDDQINSKRSEFDSVTAELAAVKLQVTDAEKDLQTKRREVDTLNDQMKADTEKVAHDVKANSELAKTLAAKDTRLESFERELTNRLTTVGNRELALGSRNEQLNHCQRALDGRESDYQRKKRRLELLQMMKELSSTENLQTQINSIKEQLASISSVLPAGSSQLERLVTANIDRGLGRDTCNTTSTLARATRLGQNKSWDPTQPLSHVGDLENLDEAATAYTPRKRRRTSNGRALDPQSFPERAGYISLILNWISGRKQLQYGGLGMEWQRVDYEWKRNHAVQLQQSKQHAHTLKVLQEELDMERSAFIAELHEFSSASSEYPLALLKRLGLDSTVVPPDDMISQTWSTSIRFDKSVMWSFPAKKHDLVLLDPSESPNITKQCTRDVMIALIQVAVCIKSPGGRNRISRQLWDSWALLETSDYHRVLCRSSLAMPVISLVQLALVQDPPFSPSVIWLACQLGCLALRWLSDTAYRNLLQDITGVDSPLVRAGIHQLKDLGLSCFSALEISPTCKSAQRVKCSHNGIALDLIIVLVDDSSTLLIFQDTAKRITVHHVPPDQVSTFIDARSLVFYIISTAGWTGSNGQEEYASVSDHAPWDVTRWLVSNLTCREPQNWREKP